MLTHVPTPRRLLIVAALAVCVLALIVWIRGSTLQQAQAMLDDLQEGFGRGQARMLVGVLDSDYPFTQLWPDLAPVVERVDDIDDERELVQRLLMQYFFQNRQVSRSLHTTLHELEALAKQPGHYHAIISLRADVSGHHPAGLRPAELEQHRFLLRKRGILLPRFTIVSHDPIALR